MTESEILRDRIVQVLKTVYDPEIPVDIYELGLIYSVDVAEDNTADSTEDNTAGAAGEQAEGNPKEREVGIVMTLTSPMCPVAETLPPEVEDKVRAVQGVASVSLDLVWDPPWTPDLMSEAAKLELNM
jgi:metal-sulfur cluster biosynthetic enzyme